MLFACIFTLSQLHNIFKCFWMGFSKIGHGAGGHWASSKVRRFSCFLLFLKETKFLILFELFANCTTHVKCHDFFSLKKKKKKMECYLLQILLGTLRAKCPFHMMKLII